MWDAPLFSSLVDPLCERKLVGGPGFEPGASRSRNLGLFVRRDCFRGF